MSSPVVIGAKPKYQLIGTEVSLYTGKVRAYLRFKQIPFEEVLSSAQVYKDIIIPRTGVKYIPVLITDDNIAVQDTTDIIDYCETRFPEPSVYPSTPTQKLVALLMEIYGDEWLVNPAMHFRWSFTENREFAYREFGRTNAPDKSPQEQYEIGKQRAIPFAGALPRLGITEKTGPAIEKSYAGFLADFDHHLQDFPFLLGDRPSIGDYGLIGPLYAHLFRDPFSGDLMRKHAPNVVDWVKRVHGGKGSSRDFLAGDAIPDTLIPLLARMFNEQVPVIRSTNRHLQHWVSENGEQTEVPRAIGSHCYRLGDVEEERLIFPYNLWMWQRAYDFYHSVDSATQQKLNDFLSAIPSAVESMRENIPCRLRRVNNKLCLDP